MSSSYSKNTPFLSPSEESTCPYSITEEILQERLNKPTYGRVVRQIFAGILACFSSFSFGTILGWTHSVTSEVTDPDPDFTPDQLCWLTSLSLLGSSFGVTSCVFLMKQMGPKKVLQVIGPLYILNWFLVLMPKTGIQMAGRFFLGFLGVSYATCGDTLFLQTVHGGIRKYISVIQSAAVYMGILMSRIVGKATSQKRLTTVCALIPIVHYVLIQIVPESPVFLYATSHVAAAKSLTWYRGKDNFYEDMANIKKDWDTARQDSDAYRYMLFSRVVYRSLLVVIVVTILQITSGYFIFMFFGLDILTGRVVFTPVLDSSIVAGCFVLTKILWESLHTAYSDWKVRGLLICSCFFTAVCLGLLASFLMIDEFHTRLGYKWNWIPIMTVALFLFFGDMGLNHYPRILVVEYMPFQMYKRATSIVQALFWMMAFLNIYVFARTLQTIPVSYVFGCFSLIMFFGAVFCYFCVVETRGKSLIQIQLQFGGNPTGTRGSLYKRVKQGL